MQTVYISGAYATILLGIQELGLESHHKTGIIAHPYDFIHLPIHLL